MKTFTVEIKIAGKVWRHTIEASSAVAAKQQALDKIGAKITVLEVGR